MYYTAHLNGRGRWRHSLQRCHTIFPHNKCSELVLWRYEAHWAEGNPYLVSMGAGSVVWSNHDLVNARSLKPRPKPNAANSERQSKKAEDHLGGLGVLGRNHLLAILVVADARGRSTVATAFGGADTARSPSAGYVLGWGIGTTNGGGSTKVLLNRPRRRNGRRGCPRHEDKRTGQSCRGSRKTHSTAV